MSDYIKQIQTLETKIQDNKTELTKLSERLKVNEEEKKKLLVELKELNISEDDLNDKISDLDVELNNKITEIEKELDTTGEPGCCLTPMFDQIKEDNKKLDKS